RAATDGCMLTSFHDTTKTRTGTLGRTRPMPTYTETEQRNIESVTKMFEAGREFDRARLFADDAVWWNGLPRIPGNVGQTEHRGIDAIRNILHGSGKPH